MKKLISNLIAKMKNRLNKALEQMAKDNQQQFGSGRLDCCDLNRDKKPQFDRQV